MFSFDCKLPSEPSLETIPDTGVDAEEGSTGHTAAISKNSDPASEQLTHSQQIAAVCSDTSRKLDCMTAELQNSDTTVASRRREEHQDCEKEMIQSPANQTASTVEHMTMPTTATAAATNNNPNCDAVDGPQSFASVVQNGQQLNAIMQGRYMNDGKPCTNRYASRSSISPTRLNIAVKQPLAATDHNQILSSVDANCSKTLYPVIASQYQQSRQGITKTPIANVNDEVVEVVASPAVVNPSQQQLPCDNCAVAVDAIPADYLYSNSNTSQANQQHGALPNANTTTHSRQSATTASLPHQANSMDESIMILPEFQRMDITNGGGQVIGNGNGNGGNSATSRREFHAAGRTYSMPTASNSSGGLSTPTATYTAAASSSSNGSVSPPPPPPNAIQHAQPIQNAHQHNAGMSRFSAAGMRSLPLTPPASHVHERPTVAISCPDGLAHALSEQNLRLQQIVQEHRVCCE